MAHVEVGGTILGRRLSWIGLIRERSRALIGSLIKALRIGVDRVQIKSVVVAFREMNIRSVIVGDNVGRGKVCVVEGTLVDTRLTIAAGRKAGSGLSRIKEILIDQTWEVVSDAPLVAERQNHLTRQFVLIFERKNIKDGLRSSWVSPVELNLRSKTPDIVRCPRQWIDARFQSRIGTGPDSVGVA